MTRIAAVTSALVIATSIGADAHRLDEYLQAARVAVSSTGIVVHLDLTPGVSLASDVIATVDRDGDGRMSPQEAEAYGRVVLGDVSARLDGAPLGLTLARVEVPTAGEMRDGVGTIRIEATAAHAGPPGPHQFELRNLHRPGHSVYLANALQPETGEIRIVRQRRDVRQQTFALDYEVRASNAAAAGWLIAAAAALMAHARWRMRGDLHHFAGCYCADPGFAGIGLRGSFSGAFAAYHANTAATAPCCFRSSGWMRSNVSMFEWCVRD